MLVHSSASEKQKKLALLMTSQIQTAGHKMAAPMAVFLQTLEDRFLTNNMINCVGILVS